MKADKMLVLTNMLAKIISELDDVKAMIKEMKMDEVTYRGGFTEEE
tara:strand:+ start:183 stop:320 length:138 start_codon:yes stop_codon:yes gene_type:complete